MHVTNIWNRSLDTANRPHSSYNSLTTCQAEPRAIQRPIIRWNRVKNFRSEKRANGRVLQQSATHASTSKHQIERLYHGRVRKTTDIQQTKNKWWKGNGESENKRLYVYKNTPSWWLANRGKHMRKSKQADDFFFDENAKKRWTVSSLIHRGARDTFWSLLLRRLESFFLFPCPSLLNCFWWPSKIAQITFFAFVPTSRRRWGENVVVLHQQCDNRVRNVGCYPVHIASLPPFTAIV